MKLIIGNDHKGTKLKKQIISFLRKEGYEIENIGTDDETSTDYPKYAFEVGNKILNKTAEFGILICGTGIGMSITANKVHGVRCALVHSVREAKLSREHNDANVLALPSNMCFITAKKIVKIFLNTNFSEEERHINRINLIKEYEK